MSLQSTILSGAAGASGLRWSIRQTGCSGRPGRRSPDSKGFGGFGLPTAEIFQDGTERRA
jgi:hypothetical protein